MGNNWDRGSKRRGFDGDDFGGQERVAFRPRFTATRAASDDDGPTVDATVKWFKADKGFGFVELSDGSGDVFLHIKVLERAGHASLDSGAKLRVQVGEGQKGRQVTAIIEVPNGGSAPAQPERGPSRRSSASSPGPASEIAGIVKWYDAGKGFGFAEAEDGQKDVFIHASVVEKAGLRDLAEAQRVLMQVVSESRGRKATALRLID
jgi:CspA family cold shock protein